MSQYLQLAPECTDNLCRSVEALNNKYLWEDNSIYPPETARGSITFFGVKKGRSDSLATSTCVFEDPFVTQGRKTANLSPTYGPGAAALNGVDPALLDLVNAFPLTASAIPEGVLMEWGTFTIDTSNYSSWTIGVNDGSALTTRRWVAYEAGGDDYTVALYDGRTYLNRWCTGSDCILTYTRRHANRQEPLQHYADVRRESDL